MEVAIISLDQVGALADVAHIISESKLNLVGITAKTGKDKTFRKGFTHSYEYYITDDAGILRVTMPGGEETRFLRLKGGGYKSLQNSGFSLSDISGGYVMEHENARPLH